MKYLRTILPIAFLLIVTASFFYQVFAQRKIPIAADAIVGLYNPFRDFYSRDYPNGIPFKNFLITDPVRQQFPWRVQAIESLQKVSMPLWNPYSGSGTPLLANFQTGVFYPFNIVFFLLPFVTTWTFLVVLQTILSAVFMYFYLRYMKLSMLAGLFGGLSFAFSGFSIAWLEWNTIVQTTLWVPLILLAKEHYLKRKELAWLGVSVFSECALIFAGHLQAAFYSLIIINTYLFARIYQLGKANSLQRTFAEYWKLLTPFLFVGTIVAFITAVQWVPTLQLISHSARELDQANWNREGWFLPWQNLIQFVAPDFFGNPSTLNYWGIWNYAEFLGYIGIVPLLFAIYALLFRRDKKTIFFGALFFLSLFFSLPTAIAKLPYILSLPFLSTTQPTRLLFVTDFSLAILCALGIDFFQKRKERIIYPLVALGIVLGGLWAVASFFFLHFGITPDQASVSRNNLKLPLFLFVLASLLFTPLFLSKKRFFFQTSLCLLLMLTVFDLARFGWKFTSFTDQKYLFPTTKSLAFLQNDDSKFRIMTTDSRIFPPNFSSMYKLESVDIYDPLYLKRYGQFIAAMERGEPNIDPPFGFNRIITPHNINSPLVNLLNVKYVLSLSDISSDKYSKVFQEGNTMVYENNDNLPRAYFVQKIIPAVGENDAIKKLFRASHALETSAVVEGLGPDQAKNLTFSQGDYVSILSYSPNAVILKTKNIRDGFLVFLDVNYPQWKATIQSGSNVVPAKIYQTDFLFRGVFVPKGEHIVTFSIELI